MISASVTQGKGQAFLKLLVQWFAASHSHTNTHTHSTITHVQPDTPDTRQTHWTREKR